MMQTNKRRIFKRGSLEFIESGGSVYKVNYEKETVKSVRFEEMLFEYMKTKDVFKNLILSYIRLCQKPEMIGFEPEDALTESDLDAITDLLCEQGAMDYVQELEAETDQQEIYTDYSDRYF